ncbi:sigma-70 family RNA polymerase sigma factor family protein [Allosalinactinospora lopnorensis]|uniref:hypothetical protein n=1 Tax=Allosalinactinospora lopnorensis TaxID=1352348 RepID=UPI000623CBFE|nr:hypothetical protein [Allosalinactinospora lopnorensis]
MARTLLAWGRAGGLFLSRVGVNGQPDAMAFGPEGRLISVIALDIADGRVRAVSSVVNPDELGHLNPVPPRSAAEDSG